jgi:hypothetical protein
MSRESTDGLERPYTHAVRIEQAMATLDYREMIALAQLFEDWAFSHSASDGDRNTWFLQIALDYGQIADFCGASWTASDQENSPSLMAFIARRELALRRSVMPGCDNTRGAVP